MIVAPTPDSDSGRLVSNAEATPPPTGRPRARRDGQRLSVPDVTFWRGEERRLEIRPRCLALRVIEPRARFLELLHVDVTVTFLYAAISETRLVEARFILLGGGVGQLRRVGQRQFSLRLVLPRLGSLGALLVVVQFRRT